MTAGFREAAIVLSTMTPASRKLSSASFVVGVAAGVAACTLLTHLYQRRQRRCRRKAAPRRFGGAIQLKPDKFARYTELHDKVWEGVLERMYKSNMRNFTIYYHAETSTLFHHFEWVGHWYRGDSNASTPEQEREWFDADMQAVAADPVVKEWWIQCEPCQEPFSQWIAGSPPPSEGGQGDWWAPLVNLTHCGHWPVEYSDERRDPDFIPQNPDGNTSSQPKPLPSEDKKVNASREQ